MAAEGRAEHGEDVAVSVGDFFAFGDGNGAAAGDDALEGGKADEGVSADLFAVLDRLQQEALALRPGGAQKGGDRRFEVGGQGAADGDEGVFFGERQELLAGGLDGLGRSLHRPQCNRCGGSGRRREASVRQGNRIWKSSY